MSGRGRVVDLAVNRGGLLGVATLALYAILAPTWILGGDNAEMVTIGAQGGVPHPSGYPLYVLWLRATSWLPAASLAHAAALATAALAAAHVVMLHAACRAWGARPAVATLVAAVFAASPLAMLIYSQAEVFALNGLAASTVLWLAAPAGPVRGGRRTILLALVAGLALANQLTIVLLAPLGLYGAILGLREVAGRRRRVAIGAGAIGALILGLSPYLYFLVAPGGGLSWGRIDGLGALLGHAMRSEYGSGSLVAKTAPIESAANLAAIAGTLARCWLVLVPIGLAAIAASIARGSQRLAWVALGATVLATSLIVAVFNVVPRGIDRAIVERFHLLPSLVLAVPIAVGVEWLVVRAARRFDPPVRTRRLLAIACFAVLPIAAAPNLDQVARAHSPAVERAVRNILRSLPPDAVVITAGDHLHFGIGYAQLVERVRPDVVHVTWDILSLGWYRDRIDARLGFPIIPDGPDFGSLRMADAVLAHGRPLFVDGEQRRILSVFPSYPYGAVIRVLPRGAALPPVDELLPINRAVFDAYDLDYRHPAAGDGWPALVHDLYAYNWWLLSTGLRRAGRPEVADEALARSTELAPY